MYNTPVLKIPNATETLKDAAQYMFYRGTKQYNLCMQFCVAYCMQDETGSDNIDDYLAYWEATDVKWWNTIFKSKLSRTTGVHDINKALNAYSVIPVEWKTVPVDMYSFENMLKTHQAIVGVSINYAGYLANAGIRHWVVLDHIKVADQNHAIIRIYNPFTNRNEPYSFKELKTSMGTYTQGVWVER
jgi:hypothetical protein